MTTRPALICASILSLAAVAANAEYPERAVTVMVPFAAGGGADVPARLLAMELEKELGQSIVVTNVVGAGGTVGATQLADGPSDGYNIGFMPVGTTTTQPHSHTCAAPATPMKASRRSAWWPRARSTWS